MTTLREAAQQAMGALEGWKDDAPSQWTTRDEKTISALRAALEQPERPNLLGWSFHRNSDGSIGIKAPPPKPGESRRTSDCVGPQDRDLHELLGKLADHMAALEQPEQDVPETDCGNMQVEWADIPKEFNDWWDADRLTQTNPFREDSPAYWAWEGWQARAALEQPEQEPEACFIGAKGGAFDLPTTKRAYTYAEQPGNVVASKLGRALETATRCSASDSIDAGLVLLKALQAEGFGVFQLGAEYTHPPRREWRGLTEEELKACLPPDAVRVPPGWLNFARAIEAALKEKNHE